MLYKKRKKKKGDFFLKFLFGIHSITKMNLKFKNCIIYVPKSIKNENQVKKLWI